MARITWWQITAPKLNFRLVQQDVDHACYWKPRKLPKVSKVMDFVEEPTLATF